MDEIEKNYNVIGTDENAGIPTSVQPIEPVGDLFSEPAGTLTIQQSDRHAGGRSGGRAHDAGVTKAVVFSAALTALLTSAVLFIFLRMFGLFYVPGTVNFQGARRSIASVQKLQQVWDALSKDYYVETDEDQLIEAAAAAMVNSLGDIYTTYYTKEEMRQFTEHSAGIFYGIGVYVSPDQDNNLYISGFLDNSPALESGVVLGDVIISVDGVDVRNVVSTAEIINMIKGEAGAEVTIGFYRPSDELEYVFDIERREIKADNIFSSILYTGGGSGGSWDGGVGGVGSNDGGGIDTGGGVSGDTDTGTDVINGIPVGYIYIKMFDGSAAEYFNRHLDALLDAGIAALIVDVRSNPGGDFEQTVKIADRLMGEGVVVYTEDRAGQREYRYSDAGALGMPIRVLINGDSASASEILAGAIKDSGAGVLIGETTFGKGLVQAVIQLSDGSGLKYTRSRYFTPSGECIDGVGIRPNIYIRQLEPVAYPSSQESAAANDRQLKTALSHIEKVMSSESRTLP